MKNLYILSLLFVATLMGCSSEVTGPELPEAQNVDIPSATALDAKRVAGVWRWSDDDQTITMNITSVDDGDAVLEHTYVDGVSGLQETIRDMEYTYTFDNGNFTLTPSPESRMKGAVDMVGVHIGDEQMALFTKNPAKTDCVCVLTRVSDPVPSITSVDRTMPMAGDVVTITGRNLQYVDGISLPVAGGWLDIKDADITSKEIRLTIPVADYVQGSMRLTATGAHVYCYSPEYMFARECVFMKNFKDNGTAPYAGTEFEYSIETMGGLRSNVKALSSSNLPEGHSLTLNQNITNNPDSLLSLWDDAPKAWTMNGGASNQTGYLRFSSGDRFKWVMENGNGFVDRTSKCNDLALQMDIYVYCDGKPQWDCGYLSYRFNKDRSAIDSPSSANIAPWTTSEPMDFSNGWKTITIPLSEVGIAKGQTLAQLVNTLLTGKNQTILTVVNMDYDQLHPARDLDSFQFSIANIRLVPNKPIENTPLN